VLNVAGYAELADISLHKIMKSDWSDWTQATIGLETKNNGILYDLAQCSDGFRYAYKGNAHRFSLESSIAADLDLVYLSDEPASPYDWTEITVSPSSFLRDEYDVYENSFDLDLSKVKEIRWTVRPSDQQVTTGFLQIKDFYCLGGNLLGSSLSSEEQTCINAGKIWNGTCETKTAEATCIDAGNIWLNGSCKTATEIAKEECTAKGSGWVWVTSTNTCREKTDAEKCAEEGKVWENNACREKTPAEICIAAGNVFEDGICKSTPVLSQIATGPLYAYATSNTIIIGNLPSNAKAEIYNLQGKRIYFGNSRNSQILKIQVQTKGMYIVKTSFGSEVKTIKVLVK